jgi:site-specific recombinase XerD
MSKLRAKMIRAMELKNLSNHTQRAYLSAVTGLAKHYHKSPEKISKQRIEDYLLYLKNQKGNAPNSCASVLTGLRFFYNNVTGQHTRIDYRARKKVRKLPCVLTQQQIWSIICAPNNLIPQPARQVSAGHQRLDVDDQPVSAPSFADLKFTLCPRT